MTEMKTFSIKIQRGLLGPASWSYKGWQVLSAGWRKVLFPQLHSQGNTLQAWRWEPVWLGSEACQHIQEVKSIYLRSPAQVQGTQGFLLRPGKDLESPSARLEPRFPYRLIPAWIDASLQTALHLFILQ